MFGGGYRCSLTATSSLLLLLPLIIMAVESKAKERQTTHLLGYLTGSQRKAGDQEYSRPGLSISGAITLAVEEVNQRHPLRDDHALDFVVAETYGDENTSIYQVASLWSRNIAGYIGPQETCVHEARMASSFNLPMISYYCTKYETSDKSVFPTFARTRPPDTQISKSVASVLLAFKWRKVSFFYSKAKDTGLEDIANTIVKTIQDMGVDVLFKKTWNITYHHGYVDNPFRQLVEETFMDSRIYVILGQYYEHLGLMISMKEKGLFDNGEYFVVGVDIEQYDQDYPGKYLRGLLKEETEEAAKDAYRFYFGVIGSPPVGFDDFSVKVNAYMEKSPFNFPNPLTRLGGMKRIRAEAAYLYDAVRLYAEALNDTLANKENPLDGKTIFKYIKGRLYQSAMGYTVYMDENGDAEGNYTLIARRPMPNTTGNEYGLFPVGVFQLSINKSRIPILQLTSEMEWVGGVPPVDEPICGFHGEKCYTHTYTGEIIAGVVGGIAFIIIVVSLIVYRNWSYEQELDSLLWKIDFKEVQINEFTPTSAAAKLTRTIHSVMGTSQVSLSSNPETDFRYSTIYTQIATYKGRIFAIKKLKKKHIDVTREMKKELKTMRDLRHDNLNAFIGACVDPPNICIITEYCARGSLKDILEKDGVNLDNMFISSLVGDIIRGMVFLHDSPIKSHGSLRTTTCLVDSRWVLKIADFGLHDFKSTADNNNYKDNADKKYEDLLYTAPELLKDVNAPSNGTQRGDVYSFSLILYEIFGRRGPYGLVDMSAAEILKQVKVNAFRPQLEQLENSFDFVRDCLRVCWSENPEDRPDFKAIRHRLRPMWKGLKPNIFDNMIAMMEKYANNLEALVDERTDQLIEEKKKTEALLYEMLPRYVAEQLKHGNKVEAESFDLVTIYFSDIVGFTTMSAESTPLQVVNFLNDLYTCFDSIIENYDVYKVETIGDAYMVVSGLPIRNGDHHAGEIASMSLSLLEAVRKFKIRHRPLDTLMLRIGIHSGPVCAGVVGLKMPRYCLFGDTVNTASRMESTGLALKIHCSEQCGQILFKLGGYFLEERGLIKVKGKGDLRTYWLLGESTENKLQRLRQRKRPNGLTTTTSLANHNGFLMNGFRSSLKNVSSVAAATVAKSPVGRTFSLDSPKKLRFAIKMPETTIRPKVTAVGVGNLVVHEDVLELSAPVPMTPPMMILELPIIDGADGHADHLLSPTEVDQRYTGVKRNSCPCIQNLGEMSMTVVNEKASSTEVMMTLSTSATESADLDADHHQLTGACTTSSTVVRCSNSTSSLFFAVEPKFYDRPSLHVDMVLTPEDDQQLVDSCPVVQSETSLSVLDFTAAAASSSANYVDVMSNTTTRQTQI